MTEEFKKGLATGIAIGGVTVKKGGSSGTYNFTGIILTTLKVSIKVVRKDG